MLIDSLWLELAPNKNSRQTLRILQTLLHSYTQPERHYHNIFHIEYGIAAYLRFFSNFKPDVFFTWAYHDIVYDPLAQDNEARSAKAFMMDSRILGFNMFEAAAIADGILSTCYATATTSSVVNDMDLAGFGDPEVYWDYSASIRKEYHMIKEEDFVRGRIEILKQFQKRSPIFITLEFRDKYEEQAKKNIQEELAKLESLK